MLESVFAWPGRGGDEVITRRVIAVKVGFKNGKVNIAGHRSLIVKSLGLGWTRHYDPANQQAERNQDNE
jgi:hypothetical protein